MADVLLAPRMGKVNGEQVWKCNGMGSWCNVRFRYDQRCYEEGLEDMWKGLFEVEEVERSELHS